MTIYFPIAEISLNILLVLGLGGFVGFASGLFGVGGGFLLTPFLIFAGVPSAVAVASQANQLVASSFSSVLTYWRRDAVDVKMGGILLLGGLGGSVLGVWLFGLLQAAGIIDVVIALCYVLFLGVIAVFMLMESLKKVFSDPVPTATASLAKRNHHHRLQKMPLKMRFPASKLYISALLPIIIGFVVGLMVAIMGIGGGFLMVPAMIYVLGMPSNMVAGTSLFQIVFITSVVTVLQAVQNQTVDVMLAGLLLVASVVGAQLGTRYNTAVKPEYVRFMLGLLVAGVALAMLWGLIIPPVRPFSVEVVG